jgi:hypothetical protein
MASAHEMPLRISISVVMDWAIILSDVCQPRRVSTCELRTQPKTPIQPPVCQHGEPGFAGINYACPRKLLT